MAKFRALTGFSYLADEAEHMAAIAGELAFEAGHRTRVEAGQVVENLPPWVVDTLLRRGHVKDVTNGEEAPSAPAEPAPAEPVAPVVEPAPEPVAEPQPEPAPEPVAPVTAPQDTPETAPVAPEAAPVAPEVPEPTPEAPVEQPAPEATA